MQIGVYRELENENLNENNFCGLVGVWSGIESNLF